MKPPMLGLLMLAALLTAACSTPLLHSIATPETTVYDRDALGLWEDDNGTRYEVTPGASRSYAVTVTPASNQQGAPKPPVEVVARVVEIDGRRYVDLSPTENERTQVSRRYGTLFIAVHNVARVQRSDNTLTLEFIDPGWVNRNLEPGAATAERVDGTMVLTAGSASLGRWISSIEETPAAFLDPVTLRRVE